MFNFYIPKQSLNYNSTISWEICPIIIMGDFNVDILKDNNQLKNKQKLLYFMNKFQLKSQFSEAPQKLDFNIEHI
jgi:endonuclease/exonuclease/phosphatase family metal-dependent hydrolase